MTELQRNPSADSPATNIRRVMVTGATGFVGRHLVKLLLERGFHPVCLVRSIDKVRRQQAQAGAGSLTVISGDLSDRAALADAAAQSDAAVHLVGIIISRKLKGQTFRGVHVEGTRSVVDAVAEAGVSRYVHMSALGTRPRAVSRYHQSKWEAEECVRASGLAWTIFRPSLIVGPGSEFLRLMKRLMCGLLPPFVPYFGDGGARIQPVHVEDVAHCFVEALSRPETAKQVYELGGSEVLTWRAMYDVCRRQLPCTRRWKPVISQPVPVAKALATVSAPGMAVAELVFPSLGLLRFDRGQVQMSQEDSVCDASVAETAFGLRMRPFAAELAKYADSID